MQLVTFARDVAPHVAGEKRLVPDALAEELLAAGDISDFERFPAQEKKPVIAPRQVNQPQRQAPRDNRKAR